MTIFTCKPDFESMMSCIYDAWASGKGHANIRLELEPVEQQELFCEYVHIDRDEEKSAKVVRSIQNKISWEAFRQVFYAAHSYRPERLDVIYRFLILGFANGRKTTQMMTCDCVTDLMELSRKVGNEEHFFREFVRFTSVKNLVYVSHIEPKCDIVAITAEHFADRMPSEYWIIVDDIRKKAVIHPKDEEMYVQELDEISFLKLQEVEKRKDEYTDLWKVFFETIGIEARKNPKCQKNMMPLWYRKHATEFR